MAFPDDLLQDAYRLAARGGKRPRQASLRRAVSNAYYALFHLLIADFLLNWRTKDQRARLGRMFEHRKMSQAVPKFKGSGVEADLQKVIDAFAQLQQDRYTADYDVGRNWSRVDVENALAIADEAFKMWRGIRKEKLAQDHLLTMFGARRMHGPGDFKRET
jgi:uncharacterized protein (UPF0332 family)